MRPDIVLNKDTDNCNLFDTKWKNRSGLKPSLGDLRQMFVYMKYYGAQKVALIYPGEKFSIIKGKYYEEQSGDLGNEECSVITIDVREDVSIWQKEIADAVLGWCGETTKYRAKTCAMAEE